MVRASAFARAALAGNPSDGYGGATLAVALCDFAAEVVVAVAGEGGSAGGLAEAPLFVRAVATIPGANLVRATLERFERELAPGCQRAEVWTRTSIPRSVGLGGSSAIVIATTRALCELHEVELDPDDLAAFALAVETEELGIAGGLQDRVAQAYGGLTFMDFAIERYECLDPALLPPLLLAWDPTAGGDSGLTHGGLRARFEAGEPVVHAAMIELAELARTARDALLEGDRAAFARCLDGSFEVRRRILALDERHVALIELARAQGASANYTGSGGAIIAACADPRQHERALRAFRAEGYQSIAPAVAAPDLAPRRGGGGHGPDPRPSPESLYRHVI